MLFWSLLLIAFLIYLLYLSIRFSRAGRMLSKMPGPFTIPLMGNSYLFTDKTQRGMWLTVRKLSDAYYPIFKAWMFHKPLVSIRRPEDLEAVLSNPKCMYKDFPYYYLRPWLGNGLFTNKGDGHKNRRKLLTPVFHYNMLKSYINIMNDQVDSFMEELRAKGEESVIDVIPLYTDLTLNIVIEAAMGVEFRKADKKYVMEYKESLDEVGSILTYRMMRPYLMDWMVNNWTAIGRKQQGAIKVLHSLTDKIIRERKSYLESSGKLQSYKEFTNDLETQQSDSIYKSDNKKKLLMLDLLLAVQKDGLIDDAGIREEVDTFLFGGTDTTRLSLAYFTMLIAENKEYQDRARAEVCAVLEASGGLIGMAELQQLSYLEQCIKESMRIYPIASTVFRYTGDDVQLSSGNYVIPPGVIVICHIWDVHRDPEFWPSPEKYNPDRFSPENSRNRHPYSFLPFASGPRICIGQKFGMMELKIVCARLLYNFILEPVDYSVDMNIIGDIVVRPDRPVHTEFIRIDRK